MSYMNQLFVTHESVEKGKQNCCSTSLCIDDSI